jgi:hypothetical protein
MKNGGDGSQVKQLEGKPSYDDDLQPESESEWEMPRAAAVPALGWFREHRAEAISAQDIDRRFQQQEWSPATANRYPPFQ